jgi:hypothetical protein
MVIQDNDEGAAYAFKVVWEGYKPENVKVQRENYTVTGKLDVQVGVTQKMWSYVVRLYQDETGTTTDHTPGSIMTAVTATWGDLANLIALHDEDTPPDNKYRFLDLDGVDSYMYFTGNLGIRPLTPVVLGASAYMDVEVTMKGSST